MRTIHRYPVSEYGPIEIAMHSGAGVVAFNEHRRDMCIWAEVETDNPVVPQSFFITADDQEIPTSSHYLRTGFRGGYAWHLFQIGGPK